MDEFSRARDLRKMLALSKRLLDSSRHGSEAEFRSLVRAICERTDAFVRDKEVSEPQFAESWTQMHALIAEMLSTLDAMDREDPPPSGSRSSDL